MALVLCKGGSHGLLEPDSLGEGFIEGADPSRAYQRIDQVQVFMTLYQ